MKGAAVLALLLLAACSTTRDPCSPASRRATALGALVGVAGSGGSSAGLAATSGYLKGANEACSGQPIRSASSNENKLLIFGGTGHRVFLGCLSCSQFDQQSVFNQLGPYGSSLGVESVWNSFSPYGSQFSSLSVCNELASDPPVIVDKTGNYYGRLSVNTVKARRDGFKKLADRICSST
jgi:hypothetical protein